MEKWKCPKCNNEEFEKDQFQATGGNFAKIFDVQNKKFITISCTKCGYTEIYKTGTDAGMNILDFLLNQRIIKLYEAQVVKSLVIIWSFPLYTYSMPSTLKAIIDRTMPLSTMAMSKVNERYEHDSKYDLSRLKYLL